MRNYSRVLPRDLFNESKLLKCLGLLCLKIHDNQIHDLGFHHDNSEFDYFDIQLHEDLAALYVSNLEFTKKSNGRILNFYTSYNSKNNFPLYCYDFTENVEIEVFNEDGKFGEDIELFPYNYGQPVGHILEAAKDKVVYMADVTFSQKDLNNLALIAKSVIICDHHESFEKEFMARPNVKIPLLGYRRNLANISFYYDEYSAGCEILWDELFSNKPMPLVIKYIGIYDTAREGVFENEPTELGKKVIEFTYGLREVPYAEKIDRILSMILDPYEAVRIHNSGAIIKRYSDDQNNRVEALCTEIRGFQVVYDVELTAEDGIDDDKHSHTVAATNTTIDPSQFRPKGEYEFIVNYYRCKDGSWKYSLRPGNNQGKNPHLGEIAACFEHNGTKGGGHKDAAGFFYHKNIFE